MSETSVTPPDGEAQDNAAGSAVLVSYEGFFAGQQARFSAISQTIQSAVAGHDAALSQLFASLRDAPASDWQPVSAYIEQVRDCAVLPLLGALSKLDLIETSTQAWAGEIAGTESPWPMLSKKDQQLLSPLAPLWQAAAAAFAEVECGVSEWTRLTLDAAITLDSASLASLASVPAAPSQEDGGAEQDEATQIEAFDPAPINAAGEKLAQNLTTAQGIAEQLSTAVLQSLKEAAARRSSKLEAASAKGDQAVEAPDSQQEPVDELTAAWRAWFEQSNARFALAAARLAAFSALAQMQASFIDQLGVKGPGLWSGAASTATANLQELRQQAEQLYRELGESHDGRKAIRQSTDLFREAMTRLYKDYVSVADPSEAKRFAEECTDTTLKNIRLQAQGLPEALAVHALTEDTSTPINPRVPAREVELRPAALETIERFLVPAFAAGKEVVFACTTTLSEETTNLQSVLRFHMGAATEELREAYWTRSSPETRQLAEEAARELSLAGLDRVVETIAQQQKTVGDCLAEVSAILTEARRAMWLLIGSQVQAETATQKLTLKTRSGLSSYLLELRGRARQASAALLKQFWAQLQYAQQKITGALRYGRKAVTGESQPVDREATIDAVAKLGSIRARLPVVYRRLFSFYPLGDQSLLAGRDEDLAWLGKQMQLWRQGRSSAFVFGSTPGSGLTTFLNVARQTCLSGTNVTDVDIAQRVTDEGQLTGMLVEALPLEAGDAPPTSLGALADMIMAADITPGQNVCIVDRLEHLFLRHIGGTDLLGRMLRFLSATDSRIFWIATVSEFGWQLLEKSEPLALGLVNYRKMSVYDRASVEEVIIKRHRRSGLPLVFDPPAVYSPILRRRLKQAGSEEAKQAILRAQYFDDLFSASGQNIMLALFYWHLSITCHSEPVSIQVHPLPKLSFEFLGFLSLPEAFALKAFLEHATLTVREYSQIANISAEASQETFESLGNSMVVELDANEYRNGAIVEFERIEVDRRYRIRPLLVQPVIRHLRTKNIVH